MGEEARPWPRKEKGSRGCGSGDPAWETTSVGMQVLPKLCTAICPADGQGGCQDWVGQGEDSGPHTRRQSPALPGRASGGHPRGCESDPACCPQQVHSWKRDHGVHDAWRGPHPRAHTTRAAGKEHNLKQPKCPGERKRSDGPATHGGKRATVCRNQGFLSDLCEAQTCYWCREGDAGARQKQERSSNQLGVWDGN